MLVQRVDPGEIHVSRHATWGMSDETFFPPSLIAATLD
jgi:hypothetical protein